MKILAVGGGSGGHVTPVVAVLREIKKQHPRAEVRFWCDFAFYDQARSLMGAFDTRIRTDRIVAGKLRRYHHLTLMQQLLWPSLVLKNLRDGFLVVAGVVQSLFKLIIWRPDVVFTKGGYVCLPVGFAAHLLGIPLVIHDSDAHPGLTNRILSRWADAIATGAPLEYYHYDPKISHYVGIPVEATQPLSAKEQAASKKEWGIDSTAPLIVITGGGLGAQRINDSVVSAYKDLIKLGSVVLICGAGNYDELRQKLPNNDEHFQVHPFVTGLSSLMGAADVVVTRAGATTILELAALKKPTILIPNAKLTGGHQLKNAAVYMRKDAVKMIDEDELEADPQRLVQAINSILKHPEDSQKMAARFYTFSRPHAAEDVAELILSARLHKL